MTTVRSFDTDVMDMASAEVDGARASVMSTSSENEEEKFDDTENVGTDRHCQPCLNEDKAVKSFKFCVDCNEFLCKDCARVHSKLNCTRDHHIVDNKDDTNIRQKMTSAGICFYHSDKQLDQYCEKHDEFCCVSCLNIRHKTCMAKSINEISSKLAAKTVFDVEKKTEKVIEKLQEVKAIRLKDVDLLDTRRQGTIELIKLDLQNVFEHLHKKHTEIVENKCIKLREKLENDIQSCVEVEESLKKSKMTLNSGDKIEQYVAMKQLLNQIDIVEKTTDAMVNEIPEKSLELKRTTLCSRVLNESELLIEFSEDMRLCKRTGTQDTVFEQTFKECTKFRCPLIYREPSDLIFTDSSSILIYDIMTKQTKQISLSVKISAIAVEKDKIFIALQGQGGVVTLGENDEMTTVLTTVEPCVGIVKSSDMFYVTVVSNKAGQLREYTLEGSLNNVLKTNDKGENIFTYGIREVRICKQEKKLYVVDMNIGVVVISAVTFKILKIISIFDDPRGISLVDDTSLFVVLANGEVRQTTDEGDTWNIVLEKETDVKRIGCSRCSRGYASRRPGPLKPTRNTNYHSICWDGYSSMYLLCTSKIYLKVMQFSMEFIHK